MPLISDETIFEKHVRWLKNGPSTPAQVRHLLDTVRLYIDCDGTLVRGSYMLIPTILGVPTTEFLGREPYIIQSWRSCDWDAFMREMFVERYPELPMPEMVIIPPSFFDQEGYLIGKDFTPLGLRNKIIIDDWPVEEIIAPGCLVFHVGKAP